MFTIKKIFLNQKMRSAYFAWFVIALFYFYQYMLRVAPNVLQEELWQFYKINANQFSTLGSLYLLTYALLQIPLGIIVDRIGVKPVVMYSVISCIVGTLLFCSTTHFFVAQLARILVGAGSAAAFMCSLKFVADHFPPGSRGLLMGMTLALGTFGSLFIAKAMQVVSHFLSWQDVMTFSALIGVIVYLLVAVVVKDVEKDSLTVLNQKSYKEVWHSILQICRNRYIITYAILAIGLYTPLAALADLWGSAFIKKKFALAKGDAATTSMYLYIGLTVGSIVLPWLSEKYNKLNEAIILCGVGIFIVFVTLLYMPAVEEWTLKTMLFSLGFLCGAEMMCFTGALIYSNKIDSGEIIGVVNTFNMLAGAMLDQLIGFSLDYQWDGTYNSQGLREYSTVQYEVALSSMTVLVAICCVLSLSLLTGQKKYTQKS